MSKIKPLSDHVLVKPTEAEEVTSGGIVLPDTAQEKPQRGQVIAVGPGKLTDNGKLVPLEVKVGDDVIFSKYGGSEVTLGADEYKLLRESDILAVVVKAGGAKPQPKPQAKPQPKPAAKSKVKAPTKSKPAKVSRVGKPKSKAKRR